MNPKCIRDLRDAIGLCFSEVEELSSLATLCLAFGHFQKTHPQSILSPIRQMQVQYNFVKALPRNKPSVKNLVLENFRLAPDDGASTSESFLKCLGSLSKLSISTVCNCHPNFQLSAFLPRFLGIYYPKPLFITCSIVFNIAHATLRLSGAC
jgi:hypothetical protein